MKILLPVILLIAGITSTIGTAIANANGLFSGHTHLVPYFYGLSVVLIIAAMIVALRAERDNKLKPLVVPVRYGRSPVTMGHHGLIIVNHGEPAYDVSILTTEVQVGISKLRLEGSKPVFTKADGEAFFAASIERSPGSWILGNGLFDEMRTQHVDEISIALAYKDAENNWYKTVGKIERDVSVAGGLSVRYVLQERTKQP